MRRRYIDNLRWMAILLLVPYHAAQSWNTWGEPNYIFFEPNAAISCVVLLTSPYIMPLLFMLAGMSTRFALRKRTVGQYIAERSKRLLVPCALGILLLCPPMSYLADRYFTGYGGGYFAHLGVFFTRFTDLIGADGGFTVGQFWFLIYLFVISVAAVGIISLQKRLLPERGRDIPLWLVCLLGLPLPLLSRLLSIGGKSVVEYGYIFLVGYYALSDDRVAERLAKHRYALLAVGLAATVLNAALFLSSCLPALNTAAKFLSRWFMTLALIGAAQRWQDFGGVGEYLSKRSYAFYIFHFVWVVLFQYALSRTSVTGTALLYLLPVCAAYAATLGCCEIWVRLTAKMP